MHHHIARRLITTAMTSSSTISMIDIACNLTDPMFRGMYQGKRKHDDDFHDVMHRASSRNVDKIIVTGTDVVESRNAVDLANAHESLFATVGCHPTRCQEFGTSEDDADKYLSDLRTIMRSSDKVVAVGELGLDYDRLHFCPKDVQKRGFIRQLKLSQESKLPLFLHCRAAFSDFYDILSSNRDKFTTGVVHSFDGTSEEAGKLIDMGLFIGVNGCSLKTEDNVSAVREIPMSAIMMETDAPWCQVKPTHASFKYVATHYESRKKEKFTKGLMVKGRNEPCNMIQILEILAGIKGMTVHQVAGIVRQTTESVFKLQTE